CAVEHGTHDADQHAALELVDDEEMNDGTASGRWFETPSIVEVAERAVDIFDVDRKFVGLEIDLTGEGFPDGLVAHRHVGDQHGATCPLPAGADRQRLTERQKLRIFLNIGYERKHLLRRMSDLPGCFILR